MLGKLASKRKQHHEALAYYSESILMVPGSNLHQENGYRTSTSSLTTVIVIDTSNCCRNSDPGEKDHGKGLPTPGKVHGSVVKSMSDPLYKLHTSRLKILLNLLHDQSAVHSRIAAEMSVTAASAAWTAAVTCLSPKENAPALSSYTLGHLRELGHNQETIWRTELDKSEVLLSLLERFNYETEPEKNTVVKTNNSLAVENIAMSSQANENNEMAPRYQVLVTFRVR
jgi:hypothetical protein